MNPKDPDREKQRLLEQVRQALDPDLSADQARLARDYVEVYFLRVPVEEMQRQNSHSLAGMIVSQLAFLSTRKPGASLLRVFNPDKQRHAWDSEHTIIEMVNDDKPFLVDSATLSLSELNLGVHLIVHPVIRVRRDDHGRLLSIAPPDDPAATVESVVQIQCSRQAGEEALSAIEKCLRNALRDVDDAVGDWQKMIDKARSTGDEMPDWAPRVDRETMRECQEFMDWLVGNQFIFLGIRDYAVVKSKKGEKGHSLRVVPGSGLGILRERDGMVHERALTSAGEEALASSHDTLLIVTKTNARSTVHRMGFFDYIGILKFDRRGRIVLERRFIGLFTSSAYSRSVMDIPLLRSKVRQVFELSGLHPGSHAWKSLAHILETFPRDDLFQADAAELTRITNSILNLQERNRVRLLIRRERYGRFYSCLVYIPRERFNTENREKIQAILKRALNGHRLDYVVNVSESALARLQLIIRPSAGAPAEPDVALLEQKIIDAVRSWTDELSSILVKKHGEALGLSHAGCYGNAFPEAYKEDVSPWVAAVDIDDIAAVDQGQFQRMSLYRPRKAHGGIIRFKLFRKHQPIPLSGVLPILENLGFRIISERPYELKLPGDESLWIQDFDMIPVVDRELNLEIIRDLFQKAFEMALSGQIESDGFNRLVIAAQMSWRQVVVLRAYCKYLLQVGSPFSRSYMAETLAKFPLVASLLIEFFQTLFDPSRDAESDYRKEHCARRLERTFAAVRTGPFATDAVLFEYLENVIDARTSGDREAQTQSLKSAFQRSLTCVSSLDEDRILYTYYDVIGATLRTSFYRRGADNAPDPYVSFKIESAKVADLPLPRPFREIWVYSPRFEAIHLRGGKIARGGLRWSDRREDFRTEVLSLMKAQNVKNTVIVPVGAKGGFVVKHPPTEGGRDAVLQEGIACYSLFINALLDLTDNLHDDTLIHPEQVVRRDEDDTYLVVAADKGTASFSDIANGISLQRKFWLGDAFASGGSVGYDHKGMGITAKGAWEGVKRHFREMGMDIQKQPFTVVGIGDMSGDVFGNGMLLSKQILLKAAFNHQHIFLDPDPDAKASLAERRRLFRKRGSGWGDYRQDRISAGGGVYSRQDKTIPLSPQVRAWLETDAAQLAPHELIRLLLTAPVDLLWNGGIGTYVKASTEANADVGDPPNNALRVNGRELRCRVVGEGGNLGFTQRGRIEYAIAGGRINTDFIDNSAGVDTSDHEVNIKILLAQAIRAGRIDDAERVKLLASMTEEVGALVLRSNYLQTQALSMMETLSGPRLGAKQHFIAVLEEQGILNRQLEFLPADEELTERRKRGEKLTRPELSVLLSYSKIVLYQQLLETDLPEDRYIAAELLRYFPGPLHECFEDLMQEHRLKREIVAAQVTNGVVNRMGASFALRMHEDTGASPAAVAAAFIIARESFAARDFWAAVEGLDGRAVAATQIEALMVMWNLLRHATRWVLNRREYARDVKQMVERLAPGLAVMQKTMPSLLTAAEREQLEVTEEGYVQGGFPVALARRTALLEHLFPTLDVVDIAAENGMDVAHVAQAYFGLGELLRLQWLSEQLELLQVMGQWHAHARALLRDELFAQRNTLVQDVLRSAGKHAEPLTAWRSDREAEINAIVAMMDDMAAQPAMDYATVSVAVRSLSRLLQPG